VMPSAEMAPRPDTFALLRDLFNCPIVQELGGADFGHVANKIEDQPWNVFHDLNILEAAPAVEGQPGHPMMVTTLYRRYTPLIRFLQGDAIDKLESLPHGHVLSFREFMGRVQDVLEMADGRSVHAVALFHCVHQEKNVLNIQLVVTDTALILRLVVRDSGLDAESERRVRGRLAQVHPGLAQAKLEYVSDMGTNVAGKRRWIIDQRTPKKAAI
jgi:phenylacetate-coenzyme A ligase PaaK-like adenylate-forming protein